MIEDVADREVETLGPQRADERHGPQRITAEIEEVVLDADPVALQHLAPHRGHPLLQRSAGRDERAVRIRFVPGCGQSPAVQLAVGRQRQCVEPYERRGHHVVGQGCGEQLAQGRRLGHPAVHADQVGDQLRTAGGLPQEHDGVPDLGVGAEGGFDLAELDTISADLHLVVDPAEEVETAVRPATGQVTAAVGTRARYAVRVWHEPLGGQSRPRQIGAGDARAADVDLAGHADGNEPAGRIVEPDGEVGQRVPDGIAVGGGDVPRLDHVVRGVHGGLRDAVHVDERGLFEAPAIGPRL
ncbi:hypothetical protein GCM10022629_65750 [Amorphoplanes auranticolor]